MERNLSQDTPAPINDEHVDSRDFRIQALQLISSSGEAREISPLVAEVQVRQDLYLGFMSGELVITDGFDLHSQVGFHGGEYLFIHFTVPQQDIAIRKAFRVYKVGDRRTLDSAQRYTVYFMSDELFESYTRKINKAYKQTKISDIVKDILKKQLKIADDRQFVDTTALPINVVIPDWRPLEALNWLASRAFFDKSNTYFFYENLEGFHFKSLQTIWKSSPTVQVPYIFENKTGQRQLDLDKFSIDVMESKRDFDILGAVSSGGYAMVLETVDPIKRVVKTTTYGLDQQNTLYPNPVMSDGDNLFKKSETFSLTYLPVDGIESWIKRTMHLAILNNSMMEFVVPGNMGIQVGTLIRINVPFTIPPTDGDMMDARKSGKFLIVAVNHKFDMINHKFSSLMMVTRDSLPVALPATDMALSDKINKLNAKNK